MMTPYYALHSDTSKHTPSICRNYVTWKINSYSKFIGYTVKNGVFQNTPGALCSPGY